MTDQRQLPLFSTQPMTPEDLNRRTALKDTVSLFQAHLLQAGKSEHTIKAFTADLQLLADYSGANTPLGSFTTSLLNEFMTWIEYGRGVPCSRKSYARRVTTLKVFFKWLHTIGALTEDPAKPVLQRSGPAPLATILSPDEVEHALNFAHSLRRGAKPDARPELLFRLLLDTGIKKSETTRLSIADIDRANPKNPLILVKQQSARDQYKERRISLPPVWLEILDEYIAQYRPRETIFNCTARNLEYILEDVGKGALIEFKLSFEMMRWTSAVRDYRAGIDPEEIREKLGLSPVSWQETFGKIKRLTEQQLKEEAGV